MVRPIRNSLSARSLSATYFFFNLIACANESGPNGSMGGNNASSLAQNQGGATAIQSSVATPTGGTTTTQSSVATSRGGAIGNTTTTQGGSATNQGGASSSNSRAAGGTSSAIGGTTTAKGGTVAAGGSSHWGGNSGATLPTGGASTSGGNGNGRGGSTTTGGASGSATSTPAGTLPALHVEGNKIVDGNGKTIVLRGVSLPDIGTLWAYASKSSTGITARIDKVLTAGMQPHVIRLPVYPRTCFNTGGQAFNSPAPFPVGTAGGNQTALTNDEYLSQVLKPAVDYVTQKGMYVIIDYHQIDNSSGQSATDATAFWTYMASKFASYTNVLYEPYNEPIDSSTSWTNFKARAQGWVDTIRKDAPDNIIIVPSMSYDQKPGDASAAPLDGKNLVYTAHVYPGNWNAAFKQQVTTAAAKVPLFFTEWGYVLNGGDQTLGTSSSTWGSDFRATLDANGSSWTAWVVDNSWTPNMFSDASISTLTAFGTTTKEWLSAKASSDWVQ